MGTIQQTTLINFLNSGGSLYIEGSDVGYNHHTTAFFGYLGTNYISNGTANGIHNIIGVENTFTFGDDFVFQYDEDPDYMVDALGADEGVLYFTCQNDIGRSVYYDEGSYRVICTSSIFGAMSDAEGSITKANLMTRYFSFLSNDPDPHIWLADTEIDFGYQYLNYPETMTTNIRNLGYENLNISTIYVVGDEFSYNGATTFELGWGEIAEIEVTFNCGSLGLFNGYLVIESNDPAQSYNVDLIGECIPPPEIELSQLELYAIVPSGEIINDILTIYNNGGSDLEFELIPTETTLGQNIQNPQISKERKSGANRTINKNNSQTLPLYQKLVSTLRDSIVLFFDDMENGINGWTIEVYTGDDLWHQTETNCNSPSHSWWCGLEGTGTYNTGNHISTAVISPIIDLTTIIDTTVTLQFFENYDTEPGYDCCMVDVTTDGGTTWIPMRGILGTAAPSGTSGGWITSVLDLTSFVGYEIQIRFYFDTTDSFNNDYPGWFFDDVIVCYNSVPWLPIDPGVGIISAGESMDITITYDATNLDEGEYTADILVSSNDPAEPEVIIPVTLTVEYVGLGPDVLPVVTKLQGNYPNPFNPTTTISFSVAQTSSFVNLEVFNIKGQKVITLINEELPAGKHSIIWDGRDSNDDRVGSGMYFYKLKAGNFENIKKMILLQ